jgi:hypothetical protein
MLPKVLASGLLLWATGAHAADPLCGKLIDYAKAQWAEKGGTIPRHWVEFHWGNDSDPKTIWSWGCRHSKDQSSTSFCHWLVNNTNQEFRSELPIRVQRCMGYTFPSRAISEWQLTDGAVKHQERDGSWLILELTSRGMQEGESAVRIYFDSVDRELEPDELPSIQTMPASNSASDKNQ